MTIYAITLYSVFCQYAQSYFIPLPRSRSNNSFDLVVSLFTTGFSQVSYNLAIGSISTYFVKYYHAVMSIATTGVPLAIMCFAPITQFLIDIYGWRGSMLLLSSMQFHTVMAAALLRPLNQDELSDDRSERITANEVVRTLLAGILNASFIKNIPFVVITIIHLFLGYAFNGWLVYVISISLSKGLTLYNAANVVLIGGIGMLITRIVMTVLPSDRFSRLLLYIGSGVMTLAYVGMYWTESLVTLSIQSCLLGIGYGILGTQLYIAMNACVNQQDIQGAVSWITLAESSSYLTGGFVTGNWSIRIMRIYGYAVLYKKNHQHLTTLCKGMACMFCPFLNLTTKQNKTKQKTNKQTNLSK